MVDKHHAEEIAMKRPKRNPRLSGDNTTTIQTHRKYEKCNAEIEEWKLYVHHQVHEKTRSMVKHAKFGQLTSA